MNGGPAYDLHQLCLSAASRLDFDDVVRCGLKIAVTWRHVVTSKESLEKLTHGVENFGERSACQRHLLFTVSWKRVQGMRRGRLTPLVLLSEASLV